MSIPQLLGANGLPLQRTRPPGLDLANSGNWFAQTPPMWDDGERWGREDVHLRSYEGIYRTQPVVSAVIDKLTRRISSLPVRVFRRLDDDRREPVPNDRTDSLVGLIRSPIPRKTTVHLIASIAQSLLIHGNALVVKGWLENDREEAPELLWPLDWSKVSGYGLQGAPIQFWSTTQFGGQERVVKAEDTIHFAWPGPDGGEIGVSPLERLGVTIRAEDAATRHQISLFRNGSRPGLAVSVDMQNPKPEILEWARERVEAVHKGPDRAGGTIFMGANTKIQPLALTPVETELTSQRRLNREEVGMVYDLAGPLMNDLTHGTYSNVAELQRGFYRDVIPPWTTLIVDTFQSQLLDMTPGWEDRILRFDFTDKLRGEPIEMAQSTKMLVEAGLMTRNEGRKDLGLEPADDPAADELTMNVNNQAPIGQSDEPPNPPPSGVIEE